MIAIHTLVRMMLGILTMTNKNGKLLLELVDETSTPSYGSPHSDFLKADFFVTFKLFTSGSQISLLLWQTEIYQH